MKATLIAIGDELLIGQVVDTNSAFIAQQLNLLGVKVHSKIGIGDDLNDILRSIERGFQHTDLIIMTGGLGPTKDDKTKEALATYYGVDLIFDTGTHERIQRYFNKLGLRLTEAHREQCFMPANAVLMPNRMGTAPGMWIEQSGQILISLPGVPFEMSHLMEDEVLPRLQAAVNLDPIEHRTIRTVGIGESRIAEQIDDIVTSLPSNIDLAFLPSLGQVRLRLSAYDIKGKEDVAALDEFTERITARLGNLVYGNGDQTLENAIGQLLLSQSLTIATAESCSGGYIGHKIMSIPGSSAYYQGSVVAYQNKIKSRVLGVNVDDLSTHGAVSEPIVRQMVEGVVPLLEADVAIATSGIAGPDGGSQDKPVGTVWIACGSRKNVITRRFQFGKDRIKNIELTTIAALNMARKFLSGLEN